MNTLINRQVEFTLNKKNIFMKKVFFLELLSPLTSIILFIFYFSIFNLILAYFLFAFSHLFIALKSEKKENISSVSNFFNFFNIVPRFFIKKYLKTELNLDFNKYRKRDKKKVFFFFDDLEDINQNNYKEALNYWNEINTKSDSLKFKQYATKKIKFIKHHIDSINNEISMYNEEQKEIQKILISENIIKNKKIENIKILNI